MKQCYGYDPTTKAFTGVAVALKNPRRSDDFLLPAHSTFVVPPSFGEHQIPVFNEGAQQWTVADDFRGQLVWDINQPQEQGALVDWVGPLPQGMTLLDPTSFAYPLWYEKDEAWIEDPEKTAEAETLLQRAAEIEAALESEGVRDYTPQQVRDYIDSQIDGAATSAEKLEVIKTILKKIAVHVLRTRNMPT